MPDIHAIRQSTNLYVYAINNPLTLIDPLGLSAEFVQLRPWVETRANWSWVDSGRVVWIASTRTAITTMSSARGSATRSFTVGVNGSYIKNDRLYVRQSALREAFDRIVQEPGAIVDPNRDAAVIAGTIILGAGTVRAANKFNQAQCGNLEGFARYGDQIGRMGRYVRNPRTKVDWSQHSEHGFSRLAERGMSRELVDSIVRNGKALEQSGGAKHAFVTREGVAVVTKEGRLVTAWSKNFFDDAMKEIIRLLFGN
jgi:hypothetical protein